jgi:ubiquitin fusion degradation protein 1
MMKTLQSEENSTLTLSLQSLPAGNFIRMQPQTRNFLSLYDPKSVLEISLRNFPALTRGDIIEICHDHQIYEIRILEVGAPDGIKPKAICTIDTDLKVDFAAPLGYVEPTVDSQIPSANSSRQSRDTGMSGLPYDRISIYGRLSIKLDYHALLSEKSSGSGYTSGSDRSTSLRPSSVDNVTSISTPSIRTTKSVFQGGPIPAPMKLDFGCFYVGFPIVPVRPMDPVAEDSGSNFRGTGPTRNKIKKESET